MKNLLTPGKTLAVLLLGCGACAMAQSLGVPVADAWIGRPLEVTVPARFASAFSGDACVQAEVSYGDTRLRPQQVRTVVNGTGAERRVLVQSDVPINEPLVTVTVRAGCDNVVSRSYTLLPDMPSEAVLAAANPATAPQPTAASVARATPVASSGRVPALTGAPLRTLRATLGLGPTPRAHGRAAAGPVQPVAAASRLRLDPPEVEGRTLLRSSDTLSQPGDGARRATAALLWQAINADPQQLMRGTANLQRLERELAQLRVTAGRTRSEMDELRRSLDEARPWYVSSATAQLLALLVLATAAASAVLAWRSRRSAEAPLFEPAQGAPDALWDPAFEGVAAEEVASPRPLERRSAEPAPRAVPSVAVAAATPVAPAARPAAVAPQPVLVPVDHDVAAGAATQQPRRAGGGLLRVETLAATFEEVEFLVSLGLESDAMDVLKAYLEDSGSPAPLAFFELMRLCAQEEPATVEAVRRRYAQVFGVEAPRVEQVSAPLGLEAHKALSERVSRVWGVSDSLQVIERALFEVVPAPGALTLQAGRDLLCLYDLAVALVTESDATAADAHPVAPWAHAEDVHEADAAARAAADAVGGLQFALDVDLGAAPEPLPEPLADREEIAARLKAEKEAARQAFARKIAEEEDAFSMAVASERSPLGRY